MSVQLPQESTYTNSLEMNLVRIEPGTFQMGCETPELPDHLLEGGSHRLCGDFDEHPVHQVTLTQPFYMGVHQVTNAQYEAFDPNHRTLRGNLEFSKDDDEAIVFITWHEAVSFCNWLSKKEGLPYRLPTEAEWEYACRAGTQTPFFFGDSLSAEFQKNVRESWYPDEKRSDGVSEVVPLTVGQTSPNTWGLYDMHGNVEEWCHDWYGPYEPGDQTDPIGRIDGDFRVTRGGSHSTLLYYLRSANRIASLPQDKTWFVGLRVVIGELPTSNPLPLPKPKQWQIDVSQNIPPDLTTAPNPETPYFATPRKYVHVLPDAQGPLFAKHNHDTALAVCPNGDLLAIWYSCVTERGRELVVAASRLRYSQKGWDPADLFWGAPDRNNHAPALWTDEKGTLYHFNGLSAAATWGPLATILRTSTDNGASWSTARLIMPEHKLRQMPVQTIFRTQDGAILLPCDAVSTGHGGTATWLSHDNGETWTDPGGTIAGIHGAAIQLKNGRLMAFGRNENIDNKMPQSISSDMGKTWTHSASIFPPISGGQRCLLLRLQEGPVLFASFSGDRKKPESMPMMLTDTSGQQHPVTGLYTALSHDEGETWSNIRLVSDDGPGTELETLDGRPFTMGFNSAEPGGYISVRQAQNGIIHLISSRLHYAFNLSWLKTPPPATIRET